MDYKGLKELLEGCINDKCEDFPGELDNLIADTARTGIVRLPWELLKPLFHYRLQKVFITSFDDLALEGEDKTFSQQLLEQLNKFDNPPFTIQRICELIVDPKKNYKKRDKYLRALERCLLVVSTQEPDLTWMKSPRLTQLLEEPPRESLHEVVFDESMVNEFGSTPVSGSGGGGGVWSNLRQVTDDTEQPSSPSEPDQFNQAKPANPVTQGDDKRKADDEASTSTMEDESMEAKTTANLDDNSDNTPESSSNSPERGDMEGKPSEGVQQFPLSRKRSSSMRESLESSEGSGGARLGGAGGGGDERAGDENDRRTVLQEADSTTLGEHDDNGREVAVGEVELEMEREEQEDSDLEQSTPKKMRASSPSVETRSTSSSGKMDVSPRGVGSVDTRETEVGLETTQREVEAMDLHEVESKSGLKAVHVPGIDGEQGEAEGVSVGELHSSSERETSTGQLERSHDSESGCTDSVSETMETS